MGGCQNVHIVYFFFHTAVERGLIELKKLGIETQLWQETRRSIDPENTKKMQTENDF